MLNSRAKHNCIVSGAITLSQVLFHLVFVGGKKVFTLSKGLIKMDGVALREEMSVVDHLLHWSIFILNGEAQGQTLRCKYVVP